MMLTLKHVSLFGRKSYLSSLPECKLLINTINAHSYNVARKDPLFAEALIKSDILIPDGASIILARKWLNGEKMERIAGADLFTFEMNKLNDKGGICFFMGSSEQVLSLIKQRAAIDYPNIKVETYSPPYKPVFTQQDNQGIIDAINKVKPDLLWVGMTAPKQEKWIYTHMDKLNINCHIGTIGAVFDFYAGTVKRAPLWWQRHSLEWLYRLIMEPKRMWKRYIIGNVLFVWYMLGEAIR